MFRNCKGISSEGDNVSRDPNEYLNIYCFQFTECSGELRFVYESSASDCHHDTALLIKLGELELSLYSTVSIWYFS